MLNVSRDAFLTRGSTDPKRYLWLWSVVYPLFPVYAIVLHAATGQGFWLWMPLLLTFGLVPVLDAVLGQDPSTPPPDRLSALNEDRFFRRLTWLTAPLHLITLVVAVAYAGLADLSLAEWVLLAVVAGLAAGVAVNTAHEMGHHRSGPDQWFARLALAVPFYSHFTIEHNFGHHRDVATPEDCASARMNESIYRFALREMPGGLRRAWVIESRRLARRGLSRWSLSNHLLQGWLLSLAIQLPLVWLFGPWTIGFLLIHHLVAWFLLTSANYVEHYGLLRRRLPNGSYERCQPHHSWNSNHRVSNLLLFHLQRHSDHHANPGLRYQSLRDMPEAPALPSGYFGMFLLAWLPPLWFRVMNPRLLALPQVKGDLRLVNRLGG
ncbi:MAG: alkane 1-monooxygenase [Wenzhouxiangella sp.]